MKNKILATAAAVSPALVFAQGTPPDPVGDAVTGLTTLGTSAAASISPMVVAVGVAFAGLTLAIVAIRYFKRSAR